ncbi:DUF1622 domain-containing protein [Thermaurantiacus sp.]
MLEELFARGATAAALVMDALVVLLLVFGAIEALAILLFRRTGDGAPVSHLRRQVWLDFAVWIVLALEFALAADIIRTAIAPSWEAIGQLAAIAAIRTVLNWFLMRDIEGQAKED